MKLAPVRFNFALPVVPNNLIFSQNCLNLLTRNMSGGSVELLQCYNKGCGRSFSPAEDSPEACVHHPGAPIFHDALKGWSCCKKRTTDFTEFLNIPGCSKSKHNTVKPAEEPKPPSNDADTENGVPVVISPPQRKPIQALNPEERPSADEPMVKLPLTVDASLKAALHKMSLNSTQQDSTQGSDDIKIGTVCKNKGCQQPYEGEISHSDRCKYHPGVAIFHEGMKYWSCCNRKTSDFNNFLNQEGCMTGSHAFKGADDAEKEVVQCRHDWHQAGKVVVLSVYCKKADPSNTVVEANQVHLNLSIAFDQGKREFRKSITLEGVVDPSKSVVNMLGTKVEIKLHKGEALSWKKFEI